MGSFNKSYKDLFGEQPQEGEQENKQRDTGLTFTQQYSWHIMIDNISGNRRELWDYFLEMNVVVFLNTLMYYKSKQNYIDFHASIKK